MHLAAAAAHQQFHIHAAMQISNWETRKAKRLIAAAAAAPPAAASAGPPVVRKPAVALDVEYAHYLTAEGRQVSVPAWVALVDQDCCVLLKTHIQQQVR